MPGRQIVVESDLYRAVLDNRGAVLTSWQLKQFHSGKGEIFEMIPGGTGRSAPVPRILHLRRPDA